MKEETQTKSELIEMDVREARNSIAWNSAEVSLLTTEVSYKQAQLNDDV